MNIGVLNKENLVVITTPPISGHRSPDIYDMADIYIPADVYQRYNTLQEISSILLASMNIFTQGNYLSSGHLNTSISNVGNRNYLNTKLCFNEMDINIFNFYKNNNTDFAFFLELMYANIEKSNFFSNDSLDLSKLSKVMSDYLKNVGKYAEGAFDLFAKKGHDQLSKMSINILTRLELNKKGIETCFEKDVFYDERFINSLMNIAALHNCNHRKILNSTHQVSVFTSTYSNVSFTSRDNFVQDTYLNPAIVFSSGKKEMIPNSFVVSCGLAGSDSYLDEYLQYFNAPFISDIIRITLMESYPYPNAYHLQMKSVARTIDKIQKIVVNPTYRIGGFIARYFDGKAPIITPDVEIIFNIVNGSPIKITAIDFYYTIHEMFSQYQKHMSLYRYSSALTKIFSLFANIRKVYDYNEPWRNTDSDASSTTITLCVNMLFVAINMLYPFSPKLSLALLKTLGFNDILSFKEIQKKFLSEAPIIIEDHIFIDNEELLKPFEKFNIENSISNFNKFTGKKMIL